MDPGRGFQGRAPLGVQILSFSCSFLQNNCKITPTWELKPPPQENPGSATANLLSCLYLSVQSQIAVFSRYSFTWPSLIRWYLSQSLNLSQIFFALKILSQELLRKSINQSMHTSHLFLQMKTIRIILSFEIKFHELKQTSSRNSLRFLPSFENSRVFHKHTRLAILPLLPTWYWQIFSVSFFICTKMKLINVKLDVCEY